MNKTAILGFALSLGLLFPPPTMATRPSVPTGMVATATNYNTVTLVWNASTDYSGLGLRGYDVYRAKLYLGQVAMPGRSTADTGLVAATAYKYTVRAVDNAGNRSAASTPATVTTPPGGSQPSTANAGPDQVTPTLTSVSFDGSGSRDAGGAILAYAWTFGDGSSGSGMRTQHAYPTAGPRTVTLTITDSSSLSRSDTAAITVSNQAPVANAGADHTGVAGSAVAFSGAASSDVDGHLTTYLWAFGDGTTGSGASSGHVYAAAGTYAGRLTVTDDNGAQSSDATTVTVSGSGGAFLWSRGFGGPTFVDAVVVRAVAGAPNGDLVVAGYFSGTVNFGAGNLTSAGGNDIFVAEYATDTGAPVWFRRFGGVGNDFAGGVAVDGSGNVILSGGITGSVDFGGGPLTSAGDYDVFVVQLSPSGVYRWARRYGGTGSDSGASVAVSATGDVVAAGTFNGTVNLGGGSLTSAGDSDVFVAAYAGATGAHLWSRRAGGPGIDQPSGIAMDDWGRVTVIGTFTGNASFGGSTLSSAGGLDVFLAQYAGADGTPQWSRRLGGPGDDYGNAIAADSGGNLVVTGQFATSIDFGGGVLSNTGAADIYLAQLSSAGVHNWSRRYGSASNLQEVATGVAVDASGKVLLTANLIDAVDFGGGLLPASGGYDPIVVKLSADGTHLWSKRFGSPQYAYNYSAGGAADASGNAVVAGNFTGTIVFGAAPLANAGGLVNQSSDGFVVKFAP